MMVMWVTAGDDDQDDEDSTSSRALVHRLGRNVAAVVLFLCSVSHSKIPRRMVLRQTSMSRVLPPCDVIDVEGKGTVKVMEDDGHVD